MTDTKKNIEKVIDEVSGAFDINDFPDETAVGKGAKELAKNIDKL